MKENCLVIVGELSGQEHASTFLPQLIEKNPTYYFWGVGGESMEHWGVELIYHLKDFSSVGFSEVVKKIFFYLSARKRIIKEVDERKTTVAILVDFQGFNLSLVKLLKKRNIKVLYYVAPQAWAWKEWRTKVLAAATDEVFCILPFEENWFRSRGVLQAKNVIHPLLIKVPHADVVPNKMKKILLLPGSRNSEVSILLPIMILVLKKCNLINHPEFEIHLVQSSSVSKTCFELYLPYIKQVYANDSLAIALNQATICLAASGTVTLNCGLHLVPTIVCYRVSLFNEWIIKSFIKYKGFVSLVNLFLQKKVFPEYLQEECLPEIIAKKLSNWLDSDEELMNIRLELRKLQNLNQDCKNDTVDTMSKHFKVNK